MYKTCMLPILILSIIGCAHTSPTTKAFETSFTACAEAKGIAAAPSVGLEVWNDLSSGTSSTTIIAQLEALAGKAGLDIVGCAVSAWLSASAPAVDGGTKLTAEAPKNPAGVAAAKAFLEHHSRM